VKSWKFQLLGWYRDWESRNQVSPGVEFNFGDREEGPWSFMIENSSAGADIHLWDSGECDSSFGRFDGSVEDMLIESRVLTSEAELVALIDSLYLMVSSAE
jgi:hypothetical protein